MFSPELGQLYVAVPHRAAVNYLHYAAKQYLPDVVGTVVSSPLAFDATLTTLMVPWLAGKPCRLLAEDSETSRRLITMMLTRLGHTVDAVEDGAVGAGTIGRMGCISGLPE